MKTYLKWVAASAIGALVLGAGAAAAQTRGSGVFKDGNDLFVPCTSTVQADLARCEWYLMGAFDMAKFYDDTSGNATFCSPTGFNAVRLRELVVAYWRSHPDTRRYSASSVARQALKEAFPGPCPRS